MSTSTGMESLDLWTKNEGSKAIVQYRRRAPALCLRLRPQWDYCQGGESERDSNGPVELGGEISLSVDLPGAGARGSVRTSEPRGEWQKTCALEARVSTFPWGALSESTGQRTRGPAMARSSVGPCSWDRVGLLGLPGSQLRSFVPRSAHRDPRTFPGAPAHLIRL